MVTVAHGFDFGTCLKAIAAVEADLKELTSTLSDSQFHAPPRSGGWSVGYCIEHLVLTGRAFLANWDAAVRHAAASRNGTGMVAYHWWQRILLRFAEPPYRMKTSTKPTFVPYSRYSREETIRRFMQMHRAFARLVEGCRGLDVEGTRVQSPFVSWLSYSLGFSFDLVLAHERRHLWQARQVRL